MDTTGIYPAGTVIDGRYRIEKRLGRGGFATVYHAHHMQLDRPAALKVLEPVAPHISDRFQARFMTEARIAANLDHPNVVRIFDFGVIPPDERPYIAMEMLAGRDLEQHLQEDGPMDPERAKRLFDGVLDALRLGHERGIVHKDLKPSNLFMVDGGTPRERLVILDYGIARLEGDDNPRYTEEGQYTGTPAYMPPEYIQRREVQPAYDVYQIGLIFIELMTGQPVITGDSPLSCMIAHIEGKHRVPDDFGNTPLGACLLKSIEIDPADRYADAGELLDAVRMAAVRPGTDFTLPAINLTDEQSQRISGEHLEPTTSPPTHPPQPTQTPQPPQPQQVPPKKSRTALWIALGIFGGVTFCVVSFIVLAVVMEMTGQLEDTDTTDEPITEDSLSVAVPEIPQVPKLPNMPGTVEEADQIQNWFLVRNMVRTIFFQIDISENTYERIGGWTKNPENVFVPSGVGQLHSTAEQAMIRATKTGPRNPKLTAAANEMTRDLDPLVETLDDIHDYKNGRKYRSDNGKKGEELRKKLLKQYRDAKPTFRRFEKEVDRAIESFLKGRLKKYESTDPFLARATRAMIAAQNLAKVMDRTPTSRNAQIKLQNLSEETEKLEVYVEDHGDTLSKRYELAGSHRQFVQALEATLDAGHELRDEAQEGEGNVQSFRLDYRSAVDTYTQLLRW